MDDPHDKAELLRRQLAHFQPQGDHAQVAVDMPPYGRMLSGIRGLRLHITGVAAKFKYDDTTLKNTAPRSPDASKPRNRPRPFCSRPAAQAPGGNRRMETPPLMPPSACGYLSRMRRALLLPPETAADHECAAKMWATAPPLKTVVSPARW